MKARVTRKWLNESYACIAVGYCGLQALLHFESPDYYTCGVYGWNFDAYKLSVDGMQLVITTGYRGMIDNFDNNHTYELDREYNKRAEAITYNHDLDYTEKKKQIDDLLNEYLRKVFNK